MFSIGKKLTFLNLKQKKNMFIVVPYGVLCVTQVAANIKLSFNESSLVTNSTFFFRNTSDLKLSISYVTRKIIQLIVVEHEKCLTKVLKFLSLYMCLSILWEFWYVPVLHTWSKIQIRNKTKIKFICNYIQLRSLPNKSVGKLN